MTQDSGSIAIPNNDLQDTTQKTQLRGGQFYEYFCEVLTQLFQGTLKYQNLLTLKDITKSEFYSVQTMLHKNYNNLNVSNTCFES